MEAEDWLKTAEQKLQKMPPEAKALRETAINAT